MFGSPISVFLAVGPTDLRGTFDKLAAVTRKVLAKDPMSGAMYLFFNRRRNRLKVLWWDRNGYMLLYKRMFRGSFSIPTSMAAYGGACVQIHARDFADLLAGLPIARESMPTYH